MPGVRGVGLGTALLVGVLDAALAVIVPLVLLTAVALLVWAVDDGARPAWDGFSAAAADLWLVGHGVDLRVVPGSGATYAVTLAALGPALVTLLAAVRAGGRAARTGHAGAALVAGIAVLVPLDGVVLLIAGRHVVSPDPAQAILLPAVVWCAGALGGTISARRRRAAPRVAPVASVGEAVRLGAGSALVVVAAAALLTAALLGIGLPGVVGLYESAHAGAVGGLALTVLQLALLPTVVVWAAAWVVGPGFALGAGSQVGPLGVHLGPLPALPLLGALPSGTHPIALVGLLVPVLAGFVCGVLVAKRSATRIRPLRALALGALGGIAGGALLGGLAAVAAGSAGPGRLAQVGPDAILVAVAAAVEIGLPAMLGLALGRPKEIASTRWLEADDLARAPTEPVRSGR